MATLLLKKGDKGENVKILQKALGDLTVDGDFGAKTEAAVKAFQKSKGLTVDGLVGKATQKALGISFQEESENDMDFKITKAPITRHITKRSRTIKYIVVHFTAGRSSTKGRAMSTRNHFQTSDRQASADFCVDDEEIVQVNPSLTDYYCWSVGDGNGKYGITNTNSVSIEMCSTLKNGTSVSAANHTGWSISEKVINNTIKLIKYLMDKYNIPIDRVVRHYDASRKNCPGIIGWNDGGIYNELTGKSTGKKNNSEEWLKFKQKLQ